MAKKIVALEDGLRDIYDRVQQAGTTRSEMEEVLDQIANLCTEAVPDLDDSDDDDDDDD
jgi:hypothetical protein